MDGLFDRPDSFCPAPPPRDPCGILGLHDVVHQLLHVQQAGVRNLQDVQELGGGLTRQAQGHAG